MSGLIKVLSLDGGGIRGIVPALVLEEIERRTSQSVAETFDLIAGTSTGGILALGLTKPAEPGGTRPFYRAGDLVEMYATRGARIFRHRVLNGPGPLKSMLEEKYPREGLVSVLEEYLGESRLKEAVCDLLVPAYEIERRAPWFFRSARARTSADHDFPIVQVARATSAAPTFFEPEKIEPARAEDGPPDHYALVDGGVFANNPGMCAYVEACREHPAADVLVVSLGTGQHADAIPFAKAAGWGWAQWARPALDVIFDGVQDTVDYQLAQLLPPDRYFRFQINLKGEHVHRADDAMDNVSPDNMEALRQVADALIIDNDARIEQLCELLGARTPA
jgi:patatin-like phospholipase/acyl hydrolase